MSNSTMIRVSMDSKSILKELTKKAKISQQKFVDELIQQAQKEAFFKQVDQAYKDLKAQPAAWKEEQKERALTQNTLTDDFHE